MRPPERPSGPLLPIPCLRQELSRLQQRRRQRNCVASVVPGVASDGRAANRLSYIAQVSEEELLDDKHTSPHNELVGGGRRMGSDNSMDAFDSNRYRSCNQREPNNNSGDRLCLAVTVRMIFVGRSHGDPQSASNQYPGNLECTQVRVKMPKTKEACLYQHCLRRRTGDGLL